MQIPLLRDGVVFNVVEIAPETKIVSKEQHKAMSAAEDEAHAGVLSEWRGVIDVLNREVAAAADELGVSRATLAALKVKAESADDGPEATKVLREILALEKRVAAHEESVKALMSKPRPPKPQLRRAPRWFPPEGVTVGPEGGNKGDIWNGKSYASPPKPAPADEAKPEAQAAV